MIVSLCAFHISILFQVYSSTNNHARHNIFVDGIKTTFFQEYDGGTSEQMAATSIVLKLVVGQEVNIAMWRHNPGTITIDNTPGAGGSKMFSWFEAALLHLD